MIVPQRRGDLERFAPEVRDLATDPALQADHERWARARETRVQEVLTSRAGAPRNWLQHDYARGWFPGGPVATEHQTRLHLRPFRDDVVAAVEAPAPIVGTRHEEPEDQGNIGNPGLAECQDAVSKSRVRDLIRVCVQTGHVSHAFTVTETSTVYRLSVSRCSLPQHQQRTYAWERAGRLHAKVRCEFASITLDR